MFQPSLEDKKNFISWFVSNHALKRREALWILNYLLNHELLLKQIHFVEKVDCTPKGMWFSTDKAPDESFYFYKAGTRFNNPEQAFHDIRLNWKEECYIEMEFEDSYLTMVKFGILEKNPFYEEESSSDEEVHQALAEIQTDVLKQEILTQIDQALETGNQELFIKLTEQLKEFEKYEKERRVNVYSKRTIIFKSTTCDETVGRCWI